MVMVMAIHRSERGKTKPARLPILVLATLACIALCYLAYSSSFSSGYINERINNIMMVQLQPPNNEKHHHNYDRYLYWGDRIDCPGKHCHTCAGLAHQESSLRCALEEALFLQRIFVMPSRMCLNLGHNKKGILQRQKNTSSEERWTSGSCSMNSLYDLKLISNTVPVVLDDSDVWQQVLAISMQLGSRGVAHVQNIRRVDLREKSLYSSILLINRTANPLAWFMECKDRNNRNSTLLPYSFLPSVATKKLQHAATMIKALLGDYDAIHVRRGDKLKTRKDGSGVERSLHPHLDRDTRPEFILCRIANWVPPGRTIFIASNEMTPGFFSPLSRRYKLAYSSNYSSILERLIDNNYQLFVVERLVMMGAKTFIRTFKEDDTDLSLTDDPKKNTKTWQVPVYTMDTKDC